MLRVGLTGGIGSGKSTVSRLLAHHGAVVVDADAIAREVVAPGSEGLRAVVQRFGESVLAADGSLDRPALGRLVFADEDARRDLERITHPRIASRTAELVAAVPPSGIVVHDVPLLVEKRMGPAYHLVVVVGADEDTRRRRLVSARGMAADEVDARMAAQASDAERRAAADAWVDNGASVDSLVAEVDLLWSQRLTGYERNLELGLAGGPGEAADPQAAVERVAARWAYLLAGDLTSVSGASPARMRAELAPGADVAGRLAGGGFVAVGPCAYAGCDPALTVRVLIGPP